MGRKVKDEGSNLRLDAQRVRPPLQDLNLACRLRQHTTLAEINQLCRTFTLAAATATATAAAPPTAIATDSAARGRARGASCWRVAKEVWV